MYNREYEQSEQGKVARRKYQKGKKFRDALRRYKTSSKGKSTTQRYLLSSRYGLTVEQRDAIFAQNGGLCAICLKNTASCIDHCHQTGAIRGGLCQFCNKGLGFFKDDTVLLRSATLYLAQFSDNQ